MIKIFKMLAWSLALAPVAVLAASNAIEGQYETIGKVPAKHSLDQVVVEEFINFTCPHCNNFRGESKLLFRKYGKRIRRVYVPILFRGQADYPLRLFYIAQAAHKEEEVSDAI